MVLPSHPFLANGFYGTTWLEMVEGKEAFMREEKREERENE